MMNKTLDDLDDVTLLAELLARARSAIPESAPDWVALHFQHKPEVLRVDQAAVIAGKSAETIRKWCTDLAAVGRPIGVRFAGSVWLVSRKRLLAEIERRYGPSGRLAAEARAKKMNEVLTRPDFLAQTRIATELR
jgi:hypothetical protein